MSSRKSSKGRRGNTDAAPRNGGSPRTGNPRPDKGNPMADNWLYGDHAVLAALINPQRKKKRLVLTKSKLSNLDKETLGLIEETVAAEVVDKDVIANLLPENAVHQGIALLPGPLPDLSIEDLGTAENDTCSVIAVLDQVTDPHNVGAILRSAAAFGVRAIVMPDRNSPPNSGVLARSASGALETVPIIRVGNLSRALDQLAEKGFWRIGLDGRADQELETTAAEIKHVALVLGSEGKGLRQLTEQKCDLLAKLPISSHIESLNVSNAAAIAFYEIARQQRTFKG
jgi:23S rRNA (guanosine2251-2'-O)-methyltransferase